MNRKKFLQTLISLIGSFFVYLFYKSISINDNLMSNKTNNFEIANDFPNGISFVENLIVSKNKEQIKIFSNKCTHLGCKINKFDGENLVCSCHGSRFSQDGKVINGPAVKNLQNINYQINNSKNTILIRYES